MKISKKLRKQKSSEKVSGNSKGVALVLVLTVMSLATIMIMTFFQMATSENKSSATYSRGLQAQQVAEQSVNLVIAQIRKATSTNGISWASQPGAIRTWDTNNRFIGYKLYSDENIIDDTNTEAEFNDADFQEIQVWASRPDEFVDLNEPIIRDEKVYYPIVDPVSKILPEWPAPIKGDSDNNGVEGFDFNFNGNNLDTGPLNQRVAEANQLGHLPMPVKWVYQLKNGTLGTLNGTQFVPFIDTNPGPTKDNQIVARFAYWADDETSKLNLNTHAGGLAWDTPRAGGIADMNMGKYQPVQREWQRYPGHPASTHLSPALAPGVIDIVRYKNAMEMIFATVPRVVGGGSQSGTRKTDFRNARERDGLIADTDHLLPSVDEYIMSANREPSVFPQANGQLATEAEMQERLERLRFFLTTTSRAPEVTLFNTPRIGIWPIHNQTDDDHRTPFDRLIAFCCTMGQGNQYYFKRENADSQTHDYQNIPRNKELMRYLERYTRTKIPGVGRGFHEKYTGAGGQDRVQILTQIFDYIRSTNLHDDTLFQDDWENAFHVDNQSEHRTFTNPRARNQRDELTGQNGIHKGHGQVTPIQIDDLGFQTQGFGRFYTLKDSAIHIICCGKGPSAAADEMERFGGGGVGPKFPGWSIYGGGLEGVVDGITYSNIPPMHINPASLATEAARSNVMDTLPFNEFPMWISEWLAANGYGDWQSRRNTRGADPAPWNLVKAIITEAFDPSNWNYNLLYRLPNYPEMNGDQVRYTHVEWIATSGGRDALINFTEAQRLQPGETLMQAALLFHLFNPSMGWVPCNPDISVKIELDSNMQFAGAARGRFLSDYDPMGNPITATDRDTWYTNRRQSSWHDRHAGGVKPMSYMLSSEFSVGRQTPLDKFYYDPSGVGGRSEFAEPYNKFHWVTPPFAVSGDNVSFTGGDATFQIFAGGDENQRSAPQDGTPPQLVQTATLNFPSFSVPVPDLAPPRRGHENEFGGRSTPRPGAEMWALNYMGANPTYYFPAGPFGSGRDLGGRIKNINQGSGRFLGGFDVVQSVGVGHGDMRITATRRLITSGEEDNGLGYFVPHFAYGTRRMAHDMSLTPGWRYAGADGEREPTMQMIPGLKYRGKLPANMIGDKSTYASVLVNRYGDYDNAMGLLVDGPYINKPDEGNSHSLFNRTDQRNPNAWNMRRDFGEYPYFVRDWRHEAGTPSYFSPNRIVSGPGMFGSLPTGAHSNRPWQTLLFRPEASSGHPGAQEPKDHYFMDLFWMPVVEPYAISEPLSTAGKINLNYQMQPFRHVKRSTALRGAFRSEYMVLIPTPADNRSQYSGDYKHNAGRGRGYHWRDRPLEGTLRRTFLRAVIQEEKTLEQFQQKFDDDGEIFRSASEICEMHLIAQHPVDRGLGTARNQINTYTPTVAQMESGKFWEDHKLVGDNGRERPYSNLYQRVTTKSNTFKVHYRGQVIKQGRRESDTSSYSFDPELDTVVGEYRGSSIIERYLDPNSALIPDYATESNPIPLGDFYRYRIVNPSRFAP